MARLDVRDLLVAPFHEGHSWGALDLTTDPVQPGLNTHVDLAVADGVDAIRQALLLRLLTPLGSLAALGHAGYGSRLHELIGDFNQPMTRQLARSFVLRALEQEPRVLAPLMLEIEEPDPSSPDRLRIHVLVQTREVDDPVALSIEVAP